MEPASARILLIEDHLMVSDMIAHTVRDQLHATLVRTCSTVEEARRALLAESVDLVVFDWALPDGRGISLVREFRQALPKTRWICISSNEQAHLVREATELGVQGFVLKRSDLAVFRTAVHEVLAGRSYYCPTSAQLLVHAVLTETSATQLTARERELLRRFARGMNAKVIAEDLGLQPKTVHNSLSAIKDKLGIQEAAGLVLYAIQHGLIEAP